MCENSTPVPEIQTNIPKPKDTIYTRYIKRLLDIILSGGAIVVLSPVLLVLCILELIYHGKPIFYVQRRPGKDGKLFDMYKFRSMNNKTDENGVLLYAHLRITPFGRFIRRYSLDELAGLFNVFNGTMSIIGPRPLLADYLPLYTERHQYRHSVRPGLACWDLRENKERTADQWTWNAQFESDIYYVENVSFLMDVKMVLKTLQVIFAKNEMRTNGDRLRYDGTNLNDTRTFAQFLQDQEKEQK